MHAKAIPPEFTTSEPQEEEDLESSNSSTSGPYPIDPETTPEFSIPSAALLMQKDLEAQIRKMNLSEDPSFLGPDSSNIFDKNIQTPSSESTKSRLIGIGLFIALISTLIFWKR